MFDVLATELSCVLQCLLLFDMVKSKLNGTCCRPGHCTTDWPVLWCRAQYSSSTVDNIHCVILSKAVIPNLGYAYPQGYHLVKMRTLRSLEMSGTSHSVMQHYIPEEWNHEFMEV